VRTGLADAQDDRTEAETEPTAEVASMVMGLMHEGITSGIDPDAVALDVLDAIEHERFWVLTHPESRRAPVARMRRAARQENPSPGPESRHPELSRQLRRVRSWTGKLRHRRS
jgi:hypothetical protein